MFFLVRSTIFTTLIKSQLYIGIYMRNPVSHLRQPVIKTGNLKKFLRSIHTAPYTLLHEERGRERETFKAAHSLRGEEPGLNSCCIGCYYWGGAGSVAGSPKEKMVAVGTTASRETRPWTGDA